MARSTEHRAGKQGVVYQPGHGTPVSSALKEGHPIGQVGELVYI